MADADQNEPTTFDPPYCETCGPPCERVEGDIRCAHCRKAIGGRRPDPDRRTGKVWRIESRDPDELDEAANWHYVGETTHKDNAKSGLEQVRNSPRAKSLGLVFRARYSETRHFIENW